MSNPNQTLHTKIEKDPVTGDEVEYDQAGYDSYGFDRAGIHKNGTEYDDDGFDAYGFDEHGIGVDGADQNGNDPDFDWKRFDDDVAAKQERAEEARRYPEESDDERY